MKVASDKLGGLCVRDKNDSPLLGSVDNKAMVRNLCSAQQWHSMDLFLTFTCNMKKHFGTKIVKEWVDGEEWKKSFDGYEEHDEFEKKEIDQALSQASSTLLLRIWQEVCELFLNYLKESPSSPYKNVLTIFARFEYQKCKSSQSDNIVTLLIN